MVRVRQPKVDPPSCVTGGRCRSRSATPCAPTSMRTAWVRGAPAERGRAGRAVRGLRSTLREAMRLLEQDGDSRSGTETGATSPRCRRWRPGTTASRARGGAPPVDGLRGHRPRLDVSVGSPSEDEAHALRLTSTAEVIHLERVRLERTEPLTYSRVAMPRSLFRGPMATTSSCPAPDASTPSGTGRRQRTRRSGRRTSRASSPARRGCRRACLPVLIQTVISRAGVLLIYAHDYMRGDHFSYDVRRTRE